MSPVAPGIYARRASSSSDAPGIYAVRPSRRPSAAAVAPTPSRQEPQQEKQLQQGAAPRSSAGSSPAFAAGVAAGKAFAAAAASQTPPMTPDSLGAAGSLFAAAAAATTTRSRSRSHSGSRSWSSSMCRRYREVTDADIAECFSPAFSMYEGIGSPGDKLIEDGEDFIENLHVEPEPRPEPKRLPKALQALKGEPRAPSGPPPFWLLRSYKASGLDSRDL